MSSFHEVFSRLPTGCCIPKVIRDLVWCVTSPHMLHEDAFPVLPAEFGVTTFDSTVVIEWMTALVVDPRPVLAFLQGERLFA